MHARQAYHRLSRQGRGPARPKPRPQAKTLDGYLRPAPQPPIELKPLLQQMKTMFSVQPVSDVGSQPLSSPPLSSPPAFNRIHQSQRQSAVSEQELHAERQYSFGEAQDHIDKD